MVQGSVVAMLFLMDMLLLLIADALLASNILIGCTLLGREGAPGLPHYLGHVLELNAHAVVSIVLPVRSRSFVTRGCHAWQAIGDLILCGRRCGGPAEQ